MAAGGNGHERERGPDGSLTATWPETLTRWLDDGLRIPGTQLRVGLDPIIGMVLPGVGDALTAIVGLALVARGIQLGVPKSVLARMVLNVVIDAFVGTVPIAGDLFDFAWKSNRMNLELLQRCSGQPPQAKGSRGSRLAAYAMVAVVALVLLALVAVPIFAAIALGAWFLAHRR